MGLDATELLLEVEQSFDFLIPDKAAVGIRTVGEFCDFLVEKRLNAMPRGPGLTQADFIALRGAVSSNSKWIGVLETESPSLQKPTVDVPNFLKQGL